jgi:hypothetical protein
MRYHHGLGVGHIYAHSSAPASASSHPSYESNQQMLDGEEHDSADGPELEHNSSDGFDIDYDLDDDIEDSLEDNPGIDDDEFLAMHEVYGI